MPEALCRWAPPLAPMQRPWVRIDSAAAGDMRATYTSTGCRERQSGERRSP